MNEPVPTKMERDAALVAKYIKSGAIREAKCTTPSVATINRNAAAERNLELQKIRQDRYRANLRKRKKAAAAVGERLPLK